MWIIAVFKNHFWFVLLFITPPYMTRFLQRNIFHIVNVVVNAAKGIAINFFREPDKTVLF